MARASIRCSTCSTSTSTRCRRSTGSGRCTMRPARPPDPVALGRQIYDRTCAACHGAARQGTPPHTPALVDLKRTPQEIETVIAEGRNAMPAFRQFRPRELSALAAFLKTPPSDAAAERPGGALPDRYTIDGYPLFLDPHGVPAIAPPWGTLNAIDLVKGDIVWKVPLGEYPRARQEGHPQHRHAQFRRRGGDGRRRDLHRRHRRREDPRVREELGPGAVGAPAPRRRLRHAEHLHDRRPAVHRHRRRRQRQERDEVRRLDHRLRAAAGPPADGADRCERPAPAADGWINLFDGTTLNGWVHMNGAHRFTVEDGAIVGRTVEASASMNSFLCTLQEFDDFELELETAIDPVTNSGHPDSDAGAAGGDAGAAASRRRPAA